ncbi:MAG TPA: DUF2303 family protein [Alphaproteobacteria bacterium]
MTKTTKTAATPTPDDSPSGAAALSCIAAPQATHLSGFGEVTEYVEKLGGAQIATLPRKVAGDAVPVLIMPEGKTLKSAKPFIDEYRQAPERKVGSASFTNLDSLIEHVKAFKDEHSVVFACQDRNRPSITAVYDYNRPGPAGAPRFGKHRAHYPNPLSDEWKEWNGQNAKSMSQGDFAKFIEDRIADVIFAPPGIAYREGEEIAAATAGGDFGDRTPDEELAYLVRTIGGSFASPQRLMELSRGLTVHVSETVTNAEMLQSGETQFIFASEHKDATGAKLKVPNLFLIAIPIFLDGPRYRIAVRLRYRKDGPQIIWFFELYRHDKAFDHAFKQTCKQVVDETKLPLYLGAPEMSA